MSNNILFIVEGGRLEGQILSNIKKNFFPDSPQKKAIFHLVFDAEIYQLYRAIKTDDLNEYLDVVEVLKNRNASTTPSKVTAHNWEILQSLDRDEISQIYLFFDYDGQCPGASDDDLKEMLEYFNEETEHGKLFISYPMTEALKDLNDTDNYEENTVPVKITGKVYKNRVGESSKYQDVKKIDKSAWKFIISENGKKANFISKGIYAEPEKMIEQDKIFTGQLERFIIPHKEVAVLSAFPLFIYEYFGKDFCASL